MPGYNVEGPGAAFSNTIEGYLQNQFKNRLLEEESRQRAQQMAQQAEMHRQTMLLQQAQLAQRVKEGEMQDFADKTKTLLPGDIPSTDYVPQARRLGFGNLTPEGQQAQLEPGEQGPMPPAAVRFPGMPGQREEQRIRS